MHRLAIGLSQSSTFPGARPKLPSFPWPSSRNLGAGCGGRGGVPSGLHLIRVQHLAGEDEKIIGYHTYCLRCLYCTYFRTAPYPVHAENPYEGIESPPRLLVWVGIRPMVFILHNNASQTSFQLL
jgi:hypothetical protein